MTIKELAQQGYQFRQSAAYQDACVVLNYADKYAFKPFFASTVAEAMEAARQEAIVDFVKRKLA